MDAAELLVRMAKVEVEQVGIAQSLFIGSSPYMLKERGRVVQIFNSFGVGHGVFRYKAPAAQRS